MTEQKHNLPSASPTRHISSLREWDKNPRSITKEGFDRLKKQIQKLGQYKPLLITPDGEVLGGNMRLKAYRELGIEDIWVSVVTPKDEAEKLEYALSDNDRAGFYDDDLLANLIPEYSDFDWSGYSVDLKEPTNLQDLLDRFKEVEEDEAPEVSDEPAVSEYGKVYQLGRHRLMCGDATKIEDVEKLMNGQKADMVFTDPPYNVDYSGLGQNNLGTIKNDNMSEADFEQFLRDSFTSFSIAMKPLASIYVCHPDSASAPKIAFEKTFAELFKKSSTIIWKKQSAGMGWQDYRCEHEPILYGWLQGDGKHYFVGERTKTTVWDVSRDAQINYVHPTQKPVGLIAEAIRNSSKEEDIVLDLFVGSGSTLMGAEQTNRIGYMMELDPKYCDVIRKRYAKFIGKEDSWQTETPTVQ